MKVLETLVPLDFRRSITTPLRVFYAGTFSSAIGRGLTLSLFVIYLHNVRGFSTGFSTLLLSAAAVAGLATSPIWGSLTDRLGPFRVLLFSLVAEAAALVGWAFARSATQAVISGLLVAVLGGGTWGPASTMLSRMVPADLRQRAFGVNFMLVNLGIGFGGLISAAMVDLHRPVTFTVLYLINSAVTLVTAAIVLPLRPYGYPVTDHHDDPVKSAEGWREVVRDRRLVLLVVASLVLLTSGYGSQEAGYSLFVVNNLHLSVHVIGVIFFFNTTTIVLSQLWVLNRIEGRSRSQVMALVGVFWFVFWVALDVTLALPPAATIVALCVAMVIFALGETMLSPTGSAIVNEIAPEHLRGRYNAALGLTWGVSTMIAPVIVAGFFDGGVSNWWPACVGALSLASSLLMLNLRNNLNDREDGRSSREPSHPGVAPEPSGGAQ
ncbi:MAG: MFS transporter [Acidobacteriota bacterium]|nr:MFS transporter [Acidobacteriota bacterium]